MQAHYSSGDTSQKYTFQPAFMRVGLKKGWNKDNFETPIIQFESAAKAMQQRVPN